MTSTFRAVRRQALAIRYQRIAVSLLVLIGCVVWLVQGHAIAQESASEPSPTPQIERAPVFITDLAWNHSGSLLAAARSDGSVAILDQQGTVLAQSTISIGDPLGNVDWNPVNDSQLAAVAYHSEIYLLTYDSGQLVTLNQWSSHHEGTSRVAFNADGTLLATIGKSGSGIDYQSQVQIWDVDSGDLLNVYDDWYVHTDIAWHPIEPDTILIAEIAQYAEIAEFSMQIVNWNTTDGSVAWYYQNADGGFTPIAWNSSGTAFVSGIGTGDMTTSTINVHDASTDKIEAMIIPQQVSGLANVEWSPNSEIAVSSAFRVSVWNGDDYSLIDDFSLNSLIGATALNINGQIAYVSQDDDNVVSFAYVANGSEPSPTPHRD